MKLKKVVIFMLVTLMIISINTKTYAKYVIEYTIKAAEITIINN